MCAQETSGQHFSMCIVAAPSFSMSRVLNASSTRHSKNCRSGSSAAGTGYLGWVSFLLVVISFRKELCLNSNMIFFHFVILVMNNRNACIEEGGGRS